MKSLLDSEINLKHIINAMYLPPSKSGTNSFRDRPSHCLALHLSGEKKYTFSDGRILTARKNDILYLPKYSSYTVVSKYDDLSRNGFNCYAVNFELEEDACFAPFVLFLKNSSRITDLFIKLCDMWMSKKEGYLLKCKADFYNILYYLNCELSSEYTNSKKKQLIQPAIDIILESYTNELPTVSELANACKISEVYLRRIFKGVYGVSPIKYINDLRIQMAFELLKSGLYSITEICYMTGFSDLSSFCKIFKKATGITPTEYKEFKSINN